VPFIEASEEFKSKPTQHSVAALRSIGIQPDAIVCRSAREISVALKDKIALFCDVDRRAVISVPDADSIYEVPLMLEDSGLGNVIVEALDAPASAPDLSDWKELVHRIQHPAGSVRIGVVGKYLPAPDAYISVTEALRHAGVHHNLRVDIKWIASETLEAGDLRALDDVDGVVVPGGFGHRGIEGKIAAARFARTSLTPYLGLCLGMQCAVIEFGRDKLGDPDANSTEFNAFTSHPVIDLLPEQRDVADKGGTMRLGLYPCKLQPGTLAAEAYGEPVVYERHRHRFEFNNAYREAMWEAGMIFSGTSPNDRLVEIIELRDHPWFVASQFHPEFRSRPNRPHPLFRDFVAAAAVKAGALPAGGTAAKPAVSTDKTSQIA
jgi:CTP synthase